jgi:hypothetical protein
MEERWTKWRSFQTTQYGNYFVEAPVGPGIYEIRRAPDNEPVALACSPNLAHSLSAFVERGKDKRRFLFKQRTPYAAGELEYRIWPLRTLSEAKIMLDLIHEQTMAMNQSKPSVQ